MSSRPTGARHSNSNHTTERSTAMVDKKPVKARTPADDNVTPIDRPAKRRGRPPKGPATSKPRKPRQVAMGGMPEPVYEFEGVGYGKFRLAIGGLGNITIKAPISADGH